MNKLAYYILEYCSIASVLIPILIWIIRNKVFTKQMNALFLCLIVSFTSDILSLFINFNEYEFIAYTSIEYALLATVFWFEFNRKILKNCVVYSSVLFIAAAIFGVLFYKNLTIVDSLLTTLESSLIIFFSIIYFFKEFADLNKPKLTDYWFFWYNSALLIYFGISLFLFLFKSYIQVFNQTLGYFLWAIHLIVNITNNSLISVAICKVKKT